MTQLLLVSSAGPARDALVACFKDGGFSRIAIADDSQAFQLACSTQSACIVLLDDEQCDAMKLLEKIRSTQVLGQSVVVAIAPAPLLPFLAARGADAAIDAGTSPELVRLAVDGVLRRREQWRCSAASLHSKSAAIQRIQAAIDAGQLGCLLLLRFEHFANVSTALHSIGVASDALHDELERSLRVWLSPLLPQGAWMACLSEEAFMVALPAGSGEEEPLAKEIVLASRGPLILAQREIRLRMHAGMCAVSPGERIDARTLVGRAEMAADEAKSAAMASAIRWSAEMSSRLLNDLQLASAMQHAVEHSEFQLLFQPQVGMERGDVYGAEALIRWTLPTGASIPPGRFVSLAEDCGVMDQITLWSLREACRNAAAWEQVGLHVRVAVNITANQLANSRFIDTVRGALSESGLPGSQLAVEISEAAIVSNPQAFRTPLKFLRNLGASVCVDDFGVGVATLANLRDLPVTELKMDRSFIRPLPGTVQERMVVQTMLKLGKQLDLKMVAVGVESLTQWAWLKESGCDAAQGWLVGKAASGDDFPALVGTIRQNKIAVPVTGVAG